MTLPIGIIVVISVTIFLAAFSFAAAIACLIHTRKTKMELRILQQVFNSRNKNFIEMFELLEKAMSYQDAEIRNLTREKGKNERHRF